MHQMTLRHIPDDIASRIRTLSSKNGESMNKTTLNLIMKGMGIDRSTKKKRDLSSLAGTWTKSDAVEFNKAVKIFDTVDEEIWK